MENNLTSGQVWKRGGFILIFALLYGVSKILVTAIVIFQFVSLLISRDTNARLASFSLGLSAYIYQLLQYMMCNSEDKPFPFADWPADSALKSAAPAARKKASRKKTASKKKIAKKEPAPATGEEQGDKNE
ncbi:MAG: DUF4389 domain-containing protein [Thioalkalispiraceae bacterium]